LLNVRPDCKYRLLDAVDNVALAPDAIAVVPDPDIVPPDHDNEPVIVALALPVSVPVRVVVDANSDGVEVSFRVSVPEIVIGVRASTLATLSDPAAVTVAPFAVLMQT
jgi:hypothetical protein